MNFINPNIRLQIDNLVRDVMKRSKIPGVSITLISENHVEYLNYGVVDKRNKISPKPETCYELGSITKSFTALGILLLQDRNMLSIDDDVNKFVPWFTMRYPKNKENIEKKLKVRHLLYHTSGLPFNSLKYIVKCKSSNALELLMRHLNNIKCESFPGEKYNYATVNYDILGYIIEVVTNQSYEQFMKKQIIEPLGLSSTFLFADDAQYMAQGHKLFYYNPIPYNAPIFRGNKPAGYIISNSIDMGILMQIHLGLISIDIRLEKIIQKSMESDLPVTIFNKYYYAAGWNVHINKKKIFHSGSTPNYSTIIVMNRQKKIGVCILANLNSNGVDFLGESIMKILEGKKIACYKKYRLDALERLNFVFSCISFLSLFSIMLLILFFSLGMLPYSRNIALADCFLTIFLSLAIFSVFLILLHSIALKKLSWKQIYVWIPFTMIMGCFIIFVLITFVMFLIIN